MRSDNSPAFIIGWDVGGWNCDSNPKSRDAIVIIDRDKNVIGKPWRGNLRELINSTENSHDFIRSLMSCCCIYSSATDVSALMAIDTPLGFSLPFINLITQGSTVQSVGIAATNPYLHRQTELFLFENGLSPLSPVKDMIGSQATKGMHVLNRYGMARESCGVWSNGKLLMAIEAYPSACKRSQLMKRLAEEALERNASGTFLHQDHYDALVCALTGWLFICKPEALIAPPYNLDPIEGWVFAPRDGMRVK